MKIVGIVGGAGFIGSLHGKSYLLSGDSWKMSDISRLLNNQSPLGAPRVTYSAAAATRDLGIRFTSGSVPLGRFGMS